MLRKLSSNTLDGSLNYIKNNAENLYICSQEPTTFLEASDTYKLGVKAAPTFTGPSAGTDGRRELLVNAVTDGVVSANGTAGFAALTKDSTSELIAVFSLNYPRVIDGETTFTLTAHKIAIGLPQ